MCFGDISQGHGEIHSGELAPRYPPYKGHQWSKAMDVKRGFNHIYLSKEIFALSLFPHLFSIYPISEELRACFEGDGEESEKSDQPPSPSNFLKPHVQSMKQRW